MLIVSNTYAVELTTPADLKRQYVLVEHGMSASHVAMLLGVPDDITTYYSPTMKYAKKVGVSHWYVIHRLAELSQPNPATEKIVRIIFDLNEQVVAIDQWAFAVNKPR